MKPDTLNSPEPGSRSTGRNANIELLRLICMFMILTGHCMAASAALYVPKSFNYYFYWWIEIICVCSVNVFMLITGYYQVNAKFHLKSLGKVLWVVWTYSFVLSFAAAKIGGLPLGKKDLLLLLLPVLSKRYWFVNAYLLLYLFSPFLNKMIHALTKKQFTLLVGILIVTMILRTTIHGFECFNQLCHSISTASYDYGTGFALQTSIGTDNCRLNLFVVTDKAYNGVVFALILSFNFFKGNTVNLIGAAFYVSNEFGLSDFLLNTLFKRFEFQ